MPFLPKITACLLALLAMRSTADGNASVRLKGHKIVIAATHAGKLTWRKELPAYQGLFSHGQSSDRRYLYVWHRHWPPVQPGQRPRATSGRRIKIYRISDGKLLADFTPGFGGTFRWVAGGYLVHDWGCGTNCANIRIYEATGKIRRGFVTSGGYVIDRRGYIAIFPTLVGLMAPSSVRLYDISADRVRELVSHKALEAAPDVKITKNNVIVRLHDGSRRRFSLRASQDAER